MILRVPISKEHTYRAVLNILNFSTNLTESELDIISIMLVNKITVLTTKARRTLVRLIARDKFTINNHIKRLKEKNVVVLNSDKHLELNANLVSRIEEAIEDKVIKLELYVS